MSICTSCYDSGAFIDLCVDSLIITGLEVDTEYLVCVQSLSTGKLQTFEVTSDGTGDVTFTPLIASRTSYEVWITQGTANSERVVLSIDGLDYTCLEFSVVTTGDEPEEIYLTPVE